MLPGGYDSMKSSNGAPLLSISGLPFFVPLEGIKRLLVVDKEKRTASRVADITALWDIAQEVADLWKKVDVS